MLEQRVGEHELERSPSGQPFHALQQHGLGGGEFAPLHQHGRQTAVGPLLVGEQLHGPLGDVAGPVQVAARERQFELREHAVWLVGRKLDRLGDGRRGTLLVSLLPIPAGHREPGARVIPPLRHEFLEHAASVGRRVVPFVEDRGQQHEGVGFDGGRTVRFEERALFEVVAHQLGRDAGRLLELARPEVGRGPQEADPPTAGFPVSRRLAGGVGRGWGFQTLHQDREVLAGVGGTADPQLKLRELEAKFVVLGITPNRSLERVERAGDVVPGGIG